MNYMKGIIKFIVLLLILTVALVACSSSKNHYKPKKKKKRNCDCSGYSFLGFKQSANGNNKVIDYS